MAIMKFTSFSGIRPRLPESLLPQDAATVAENCDFAYGELRSAKGGVFYRTMVNTPQSIYTDDGLNFYTWTADVDAVRSPLVADQFVRMYYSTTGGIFVAPRNGAGVNGGPPPSPYLVGVQRPNVAPTVSVQGIKTVDATTATLVWRFHYEYGGIKYQEATITPTSLGSNRYQFTPPTRAASTPEGAFPVLRLTANWLTDNAQVFDIYTSNSSFESTKGYYTLNMAADTGAATFTATLVSAIPEADKEARVYTYTYVNTYGEEGPPSPVTSVTTGTTIPVQLTVTKAADGSYAPIKEIRIYRTGTGTSIASYFYVGSITVLSNPPGTFNFTDDVKPELLNEELTSLNYYAPDTGLRGLMSLPNGILAAWKGNELHFSEAYKPWAWPPAYVKTLPHVIIGGIPHGAGAIITTTTVPHFVSGVSPDSMTTSKLNIDQAGVSKWSIAVVDGVVVYASNDGLVAVAGASGSLALSEQFFTREVWRARYGAGLSTMRFAVWDGRLVVYSSANSFVPFMVRLDEAQGAMTDLPTFVAQCSFVSPLADQFYFATGANISQFSGGSDLSTVWQSREIVLDRPTNFGVGQALVEGSWTVQFHAFINGAYSLRHTQSLTAGQTTFRLPGGYKSDRYRIRVSGTGKMRELRVAETAAQLAQI
jgi:hypothetical protein